MSTDKPKATAKPASTPQEASLLEAMQRIPFLAVLLEALTTREIEDAFHHLIEGTHQNDRVDEGIRQRRAAVGSALGMVLADPLRQILGLEKLDISAQEMRRSCASCREHVARLLDRIGQDDVMSLLEPHADFRSQYAQSLEEKTLIAKHVVKEYFRFEGLDEKAQESIRCFIQGSTLAVAIAKEIVQQDVRKMLVHTNSVFFPAIVLREGSDRTAFAFCGGEFDGPCGAWLYGGRDEKAEAELSSLFTRGKDALDTVFLMPWVVTADGTLHYLNDRARHLVQTLVGLARTIHILAVADRVRETLDTQAGQPPLKPVPIPSEISGKTKRVVLTVAGPPRPEYRGSTEFGRLKDAFSQRGIRVDWLS